MKKEELFEALGDIDPVSVQKARTYSGRKNHSEKNHGRRKPAWMKWTAAAACAVLIVGTVLGIPGLNNQGNLMSVKAAYPDPVGKNMSAQKFMESDAHWDWWSSHREMVWESEKIQPDLDSYYVNLMEKMLISDDKNTVCSPLNTYIAFAMLAEVSGGNTRQQIMDMLGAQNLDALRETVSAIWKSNYADTPILKSLLANSLWLNNSVKYNETTLKNLAEQYYASTFSGTPGSAEMDEALQKWTDDNTGGLLAEYTKDMHMDQSTVLEIVSTIYYKAMWIEEFWEDATKPETFHGIAGDTTVDMMKRTDSMSVYRAEHFTALGLGLNDSGSIYFLLPDDNTDVNSLISNPELMSAIRSNGDDANWSFPLVHLSVPKFKVSDKVDLLETLRELGVTDALDYTLADFTPLTTDRDDLYLNKAEHAAMLEIDEHGVTGAAYTELALNEGAAMPEEEIDFVLDRPFMFAVTGSDGAILFSGIVRNIERGLKQYYDSSDDECSKVSEYNLISENKGKQERQYNETD